MTTLWRLDADALVTGYRAGAFTPVDALEACLARIGRCQPKLNMMAFIDGYSARRAAESSASRWQSGTPLGPLDGVPLSLKDNLHAAGWPTGWGSRLMAGHVARRDEQPVARLRAAGAVIFGKTTLPEFAAQGFTANAVTGVTRNPWDARLTPGGSSGGAAAAVASGCGPMALATDGGGSIRRPAAHCGLVGFKPSAGLVRRGGGLPEIFMEMEVVGALARTVRDVHTLTAAVAGSTLALPAVRPCRILFVPRFGDQPVDEGIARLARAAATNLEKLGHRVQEAGHFDLADRVNANWPLLSAAGLAWLMADGSRWPELALPAGQVPDESLIGDAARVSLWQGREASAADMFELLTGIDELRRRLAGCFVDHEFILTPTTAALPWPAEQSHPPTISGRPVEPRGHAVFTAFANAAGLPAISLPCGSVDGVPSGLQLVGRLHQDAELIALAAQYEIYSGQTGRLATIPGVVERIC